MRLISALALNKAPKPSLTRDEQGDVVVYTGRGKDVGSSTTIYCPLYRTEKTVNPQTLAKKLDKLGGSDEIGAEELEFVENREPMEAIMVCLDTSSSMQDAAGFTDELPDPDDDDHPRRRNVEDEETWDDVEMKDETKMVEKDKILLTSALAKLRKHPNLKDLQQISQVLSGDTVLLELCRMEKEFDSEFSRIVTRHRSKFLPILLNEEKKVESKDSKNTQDDKKDTQDMTADQLLDMKFDEEPESFICPISRSLMVDPVVAPDGFTYERKTIERWFKDHVSSPMTGVQLASKKLVPNNNLKSQMSEWKTKKEANEKKQKEQEEEAKKKIKITITIAITII